MKSIQNILQWIKYEYFPQKRDLLRPRLERCSLGKDILKWVGSWICLCSNYFYFVHNGFKHILIHKYFPFMLLTFLNPFSFSSELSTMRTISYLSLWYWLFKLLCIAISLACHFLVNLLIWNFSIQAFVAWKHSSFLLLLVLFVYLNLTYAGLHRHFSLLNPISLQFLAVPTSLAMAP